MRCARWVVLWSLWAARWLPPPSPAVRVSQGVLQGRLSPAGDHYQYFGIPYATARRFQAPGPPPPWRGTLQAVQQHVRCPQRWGAWGVLGREDCLVLNVYAPVQARPDAPRPVLVFIHGGGFKEGAGARLLYGPEYLVARDVLLVTFNYRLGVLGFLCLRTKEVPGNAGLKDQVAALRWVRDNIGAFGGDPSDVTLFGESAGGASVSYHVASRASRGLFRRAVLQSGSALAPWARQQRPLRVAAQLAAALGHRARDPRTLYTIFMNETVSNLIMAELPRRKGRLKFTHLPFVPCVEAQIDGVEPFITEAPFDVLSGGDFSRVPIVIGSNDREGYFFAAFEDDDSLRDVNFEEVLPTDLIFPTHSERRAAARQLRELYLGEEEVSWKSIVRLSALHGDSYFSFPARVETELLLAATDAPLYSYLFEYSGWRNFPKLISGPAYWLAGGATHADELFYLFNLFPVPSLFETDMINTMTRLWTNFAKFGSPGGGWERASPRGTSLGATSPGGALATMVLGAAPRMQPLDAFRPRHMQFWRELYATYRASNFTDN